ncbi:MAG: bifunctional hydroxymethylpyrimidine kinase/phosphomethylpyrimidine kinase [Ramlibacter sp.]|nr:bifunctional hydroxymethylpyrimidine kinase/phosphomethylpyrimidine kinase [Ramlibacter sp.]
MARPPIVWSVAGSDSGGGAGIQADLRAFDAFGVHGCTALAAVTAQNSVAVPAIEAVSQRMLDAQLAALAQDLPPAAVKAGMLGNAGNLQVLAGWVDRLRQTDPKLPLVVDPVLRASTGSAFADEALLAGYRAELLPRTTLLTPNRAEAAALLGLPPLRSRAEVEQAARALQECGCASVVITGGDEMPPTVGTSCPPCPPGGPSAALGRPVGGGNGETSEDYVATPQASGWLRLPRVATPHHHGTGCTYASSAAAAMALGFVEVEAAILAKMATTEALRHGHAAGAGAGPVRPQTGFALRHQNLPGLSIPGVADVAAFAPLQDPQLGLYAIVDSVGWVQRVLSAGVRTVQLRIKDPLQPNLREQVRASVAAARAAGAQLFVNDHWRLAIEEGAYGVHLGQEDLAVADLRAIQCAGLRLGVSTHAYWEVCRAWQLSPSYIACGPIHPTGAKKMPWVPQGDGNLAYWCALLPLPVVAIAGMDVARARQARDCGAAGVAVISAVAAATDPEAAIDELRRATDRAASPGAYPGAALPQSTLRR